MKIGISTACLYPEYPEIALEQMINLGFKRYEFFVNSFLELEKDYLIKLKKMLDESGSKVVSLHPFTSLTEGLFFFDGYSRRFEDGINIYRKFFEAAQFLGAKYLVLHGLMRGRSGTFRGSDEDYCKTFSKISKVAKEYNVTLCQENVINYRSESIDFIKNMKRILGDEVSFVFDIKQCLLAGEDPVDMIKAMGENLKHIHISDNDEQNTCLIPGKGDFDFKIIYKVLKEINYNNYVIIEVYSNCISKIENLKDAKLYLDNL
ncbi:MAG: sugar phosphate isomerase/epimerase [Clostridia bacterium]